MKINSKMLIALLLAFFICSMLSFGFKQIPENTETYANLAPIAQTEPSVPSPEPFHRNIPLSILVYTEYADLSSGGEYDNTMQAIDNNYGTDYYSTNLTDYTNLATALPGNDIFLIIEQEEVLSFATMETIGTAWTSTLNTFVNDGGIVILLDYYAYNIPGLGPGLRIYNESGLMTINGVVDSTGGTLTTVNLVNSSDALAQGVSSSFGALSGTISVDTGEATVVFDDGSDPIVVHKIMGHGHIVYLGFDLYASSVDYEQILGNAIRLHRHVVFDNSHSQYNNILVGYTNYAADLVSQGFAVSSMNSFSPAFFSTADVLVVSACATPYNPAEIDQIEAFVVQGGGLFLLGDWGTYGDDINSIAQRFGYNSNGTVLYDSDDAVGTSSQIQYDGANIHNHSLSLAVNSVEFYAGSGFNETPADAVSIVVTDADGTGTWGGGPAAIEVPLVAASTFVAGRVVVTCESDFADDADSDSDVTVNYFDDDNEILAVNAIRWLSAAGLKERIVLFDNSHFPIFGYDIFSHFLEWANYLTSNGYTVHWMSTFYPNLIDLAHVLVIVEGTNPYTNPETTAIVNYVAAGGGLFLMADWGGYGVNVDALGNQFGIDRNDTSYLDDSDDWYVGTSLIIYETANFGVHPIMQGISRIDVDRGTAFDTLNGGTALITSDTDDTCSWNDGGIANGITVFAATQHGQGKVVYITDINFGSAIDDPDGDGEPDFYHADNNLFFVNAFQWLAVNRAPTVTITSPNGGEILEGATNSITWTASDADKDAMTFDVLYSANNGGSWTPLVVGTTSMSVNFDVTGLPEGNQYLIRVIAFDYDASTPDESDAVFSVETEGPAITNVQHTPPAPISGVLVVISADVTDVSGVFSVVCNYSIDGGVTWTDIPMILSSGDTYEVAIGPFLGGVTVEYQIIATDNSAAGRTTTTTSTSFLVTALIPPLPPWLPVLIAAIIIIVIVLILVFLLRRRPKEVEA